MTKQTLEEVEGLPEGWRAVAYRCALKGEKILMTKEVITATHNHESSSLIVEKIQPRMMVFEETLEKNTTGSCQVFLDTNNGVLTRFSVASDFIWREVKEPDTPLTDDDTKQNFDADKFFDMLKHAFLDHVERSRIREQTK